MFDVATIFLLTTSPHRCTILTPRTGDNLSVPTSNISGVDDWGQWQGVDFQLLTLAFWGRPVRFGTAELRSILQKKRALCWEGDTLSSIRHVDLALVSCRSWTSTMSTPPDPAFYGCVWLKSDMGENCFCITFGALDEAPRIEPQPHHDDLKLQGGASRGRKHRSYVFTFNVLFIYIYSLFNSHLWKMTINWPSTFGFPNFETFDELHPHWGEVTVMPAMCGPRALPCLDTWLMEGIFMIYNNICTENHVFC